MNNTFLLCDNCLPNNEFILKKSPYITECDDFIQRIPTNYETNIWLNDCIKCRGNLCIPYLL